MHAAGLLLRTTPGEAYALQRFGPLPTMLTLAVLSWSNLPNYYPALFLPAS